MFMIFKKKSHINCVLHCSNNTRLLSEALVSLNRTIRRKKTTHNIHCITTHDYIIVGAGSAGCVLANRLSAPRPYSSQLRSSVDVPSVHLFEAGPTDKGWSRWTIRMPAALLYNLRGARYNWCYRTVPQRTMNNRSMFWPCGRVLGGGSSLNAMVYIRGHSKDYDRWESEGAEGWNYANCLPYFRRSQTHELGANEYRGDSGPLYVSRGKTNHPLHLAWLKAGQEAGYPFTDDFNGYQQEGMGFFDLTIKNGERSSTSAAYLHPVESHRPNLAVTTNALVTRILFEGTRAIGIEYLKDGELCEARAEREVILSGGAVNSPQLLMLSGIGNVDQLRSLGIKAWHQLPGVGQNLQDHLQVYVQHTCNEPVTLHKAQWKYPHVMMGIGMRWIFSGTGWGATSHLETGGFVRSRPDVDHPDIQFHFYPTLVHDRGRKGTNQHGYQVHVVHVHPRSTGRILLASADPRMPPLIDPNYLSCERDQEAMRACIRLCREILNQPSLAKRFGGFELSPGEELKTDAELDQFVRERSDSGFHPAGTCRMGLNPEGQSGRMLEFQECGTEVTGPAVTRPDCRLWGLDGLRVVDASIMPSIISGNLNASVIMIAERAADLILSEYAGESVMLPPATGLK